MVLYKLCSNAIDGCQTCENSKKCKTCSNAGYGVLDRDYSLCQDISQGKNDKTIYQDGDYFYTCEKEIPGCKRCESQNECIETINDEYCLLASGSIVHKYFQR